MVGRISVAIMFYIYIHTSKIAYFYCVLNFGTPFQWTPSLFFDRCISHYFISHKIISVVNNTILTLITFITTNLSPFLPYCSVVGALRTDSLTKLLRWTYFFRWVVSKWKYRIMTIFVFSSLLSIFQFIHYATSNIFCIRFAAFFSATYANRHWSHHQPLCFRLSIVTWGMSLLECDEVWRLQSPSLSWKVTMNCSSISIVLLPLTCVNWNCLNAWKMEPALWIQLVVNW